MNKSLKLLFLFNGIFVFGSSLFGPLYAVFVSHISNSIVAVSTSFAMFLISTTIFTAIMSLKGDLVKDKSYFLAASYLIRFTVWTLYAVTNSFGMLLVLQFILGIGESLGTPSYDALVAEHLDKNKHIRDYADWKIISNLVGAIATLVGGYVVTKYGFDVLFFAMAGLAFVSFAGVFLQPKKAFK